MLIGFGEANVSMDLIVGIEARSAATRICPEVMSPRGRVTATMT